MQSLISARPRNVTTCRTRDEHAADRVFAQMIAASDKYQLPLSFKSDMVHDQRLIYQRGVPELFGWVLYDGGTHWCTPERMLPPDKRGRSWDGLLETIRQCCTDARYFIGGPDGIREVPFAAFASTMRSEP